MYGLGHDSSWIVSTECDGDAASQETMSVRVMRNPMS